jgi:hypothetical protein
VELERVIKRFIEVKVLGRVDTVPRILKADWNEDELVRGGVRGKGISVFFFSISMSTYKSDPIPSVSMFNADGALKTASLLEKSSYQELYTQTSMVVNLTVKFDNLDIQIQVDDEVKSKAEKRRGLGKE